MLNRRARGDRDTAARTCALIGLTLLTVSGSARADRGALTADLGFGVSASLLPAPYATGAEPLLTSSVASRLGVRYALSDGLELTLNGHYEPRITAYHSDVIIDTSRADYPGADAGRGAFRGTLAHTFERLAVAAGARWVWGMVFRIHAGLDVGWTQRNYTQFDHIDTSSGGARSHGLRLESFSASNLMLAPVAGLEWAFADKWSVSVMPRLEVLVGPDPLVGLTIPLVLSRSWYP